MFFSSLSWWFLKYFLFLGVQNCSCPWQMDFGLGALSFCCLTWLEIYLQVPTLVEFQKCILRTPVPCSAFPVPAVRWDLMMPVCGLRRGQKSRKGLESWKWRSFELLPPAKELCRSIFPLWVPKGLSSHFCGIVEYPFLCTRIMKRLGVSDWSGGLSYWESFILFFFFFNCIGCLNENANYNKYCNFNEILSEYMWI